MHVRSVVVAVASTVLLAAPIPHVVGPSDAGTLSFLVTDGGELAVDFGLLPFTMSADADGLAFAGPIQLTSGPLVDIVVDAAGGFTTYTYGGGQLSMHLFGVDNHGNDIDGDFVASTDPFSFTVCEECDTLFGGGLADDFFVNLGAGFFDPQLAAAFHIQPGTLGGQIDFGLEAIDGTPASNLRSGFDHRGSTTLSIGVVEAPEPSAILLLTAGVAAISARRGISRARSSGPRSGNS